MKFHTFLFLIGLFLIISSCRKQQQVQTFDIEITPNEVRVPDNQKSSRQLTAKIRNTNNSAKVKWTSANTSIAIVNENGVVAGMSPGLTEITASSVDGNGSAKARIIVFDSIDIEITPTELRIPNDQKIIHQLNAKIRNTTTGLNLTWASKNTAIASINANGIVAGISPGITEITGTTSDGNNTGIAKVIVYDTLDYKYRLVLKDKGPVQHSLSNPSAYLSARAISRRNKMSIQIDSSDIPISNQYLNEIQNAGGIIVAKSKWLKTVSVQCYDLVTLEKLKALPFVKEASLVWIDKKDTAAYFKKIITAQTSTIPRSVQAQVDYGAAWDNINILKGQFLHDAGYKGQGIQIAVMDAGFTNITQNPTLNYINILGSKSFIYEIPNPYSTGNHGVAVTSCMATNKPGSYIGTAPEAGYWLFMTEDERSEYPIEEDYWVAALEYADSVGADIVNTSLGYKDYIIGSPPYPYQFADMDGKTAHASKGSKFGAAKGMIMVVSAGNDKSWVGAPADSPDVLTVGAIDRNLNISTFSSNGMTVDGRMKPDVVALGTYTALVNTSGNIAYGSGTSFASPVMCGLVACLWQAYPKLTNREIVSVIKQSSNRYITPILPYGWGIPDMEKAMQIAVALSVGR